MDSTAITSKPNPLPPEQRPSHVRYWIIGMATMMSFMLYLDRFFITIILTFINQELTLTEIQSQMIISFFFWSYAASQVPAGWLSDRFGARLMLAIYIAGWSLFTALIGFSYSLLFLLIMRLGMGITQAGAYPTGASIVSKWVPFYGRATASSIVAIGGRLGGAFQGLITPIFLIMFVPVTINSLFVSEDVLKPAKFSLAVATPQNSSAKELTKLLIKDLDKSLESQSHLSEAEQQKKWQKALDIVLKREETFNVLPKKPGKLSPEVKKWVDTPKSEMAKKDYPLRNRALWQMAFPKIDDPTKIQLESFTEAIYHPEGDIATSLSILVRAEVQGNDWQADLNKLLKRPDLYEIVPRNEISLSWEAQRLANLPAKELSENQLTRRNRLLLEQAYPMSLRYIYGEGWRPVAYLYGGVGLVLAFVFFLVVRNWPSEHKGCNTQEQELINRGRPAGNKPDGKVNTLPIKYIVASRSLWCSSLSQFGTNFGWGFVATQVPFFLEEKGVPVEMRGLMYFVPLFLGILGMFGGGWLTDSLTQKIGVRWGRGLPMALTRFTAMAAFLVCLVLDSPWLFIIAFCCVTISTDLGTSAVWAFKQDVGGRYVGSVLGWGNMWGNFGAAVLPLAMGIIVGESKWELRFLACAVAFAIAGIAALGVDATKPIVKESELAQ